ncbi:MAG TPA: response regulator [Acidimicrobiales bacterium]|nr:response regulator [Acidimicrobiales bacterium]
MSAVRRAVVADDSRLMRRIIVRMVASMGFECIEAEDAEQAIDRAETALDTGGLALVLADWHMPGMSGVDLVRSLRSNDRFDGVRLVMVTSESEIARIDEALAAGADEYLMKPFGEEDLADKLGLLGLVETEPVP